MPRRHPCDVCGHPRLRWQRLCAVCFRGLPHEIRTAIVETWKRGCKADWRRAKRRAIEHMGNAVQAHMAHYQAATARQLGERPDR